MKIAFKYTCLFVFIFLNSNCQREIGLKNTKIIIKIVDEESKKTVNGLIEIQQYKKSIYGRYWWTVHEICEKEIDNKGKVDIIIDSLGFYRVKIYKREEKLWFCSYEFDAKEINLNEVYEIQCPNPGY